jgi:intraflagellar transport protein 52
LLTEKISLEKVKKANLFIIGGPRANFSNEEIETLKTYLEEGGNLLILLGEGGEEK